MVILILVLPPFVNLQHLWPEPVRITFFVEVLLLRDLQGMQDLVNIFLWYSSDVHVLLIQLHMPRLEFLYRDIKLQYHVLNCDKSEHHIINLFLLPEIVGYLQQLEALLESSKVALNVFPH